MAFKRRRNSLRLRGFDYSEPGRYFVTICTRRRRCILGEIIKGRMAMSDEGKIVAATWRGIPDHFKNTKVAVFQVMPNHVHGIVEIREHVGARHVVPVQEFKEEFGRPRSGTISTIVRSFKAAVTSELRSRGMQGDDSVWHRSFHDHIIRDDIDRFFVEQYIELNPILWDLDVDNPASREMTIDDLRKQLKLQHGLTGFPLECVIQHELEYRNWRNAAERDPYRQSRLCCQASRES